LKCGAINCGRDAVVAYVLTGGRSTLLLSCDGCREHFSRDRVPVAVHVRKVPLEELPVHEVMEESELQKDWDPGAVTGNVRMLKNW
jgi:hypothetical protein